MTEQTETWNAQQRKDHPIFTGVLRYFPDALLEVAELSKIGNDQHNPGEPLHWARGKSNDQGDALVRHQLDAGTRDSDGVRHSAKVAWRALAQLQLEIEAELEVSTPAMQDFYDTTEIVINETQSEDIIKILDAMSEGERAAHAISPFSDTISIMEQQRKDYRSKEGDGFDGWYPIEIRYCGDVWTNEVGSYVWKGDGWFPDRWPA